MFTFFLHLLLFTTSFLLSAFVAVQLLVACDLWSYSLFKWESAIKIVERETYSRRNKSNVCIEIVWAGYIRLLSQLIP